MKTLYDVLGARPDDDAENLKKAYWNAAKANHPDHNAGDPEATVRFRRIAAAYNILRDAESRAAYDRRLEIKLQAVPAAKPIVSRARRSIMADAIAAAAVVGLLIGGYALFVRISGVSFTDVVGAMGRGTAQSMAGRLTERTDSRTTGRAVSHHEPERVAISQMPVMVPATAGASVADSGSGEIKGESGRDPAALVPEATNPETARPDAAKPDSAKPDTAKSDIARPDKSDMIRSDVARPDMVRPDNGSEGAVNHAGAKAGTADPGRSHGAAPPERDKVQSFEATRPSAPERRNGAARSSPRSAAAAGEKHEGRPSESGNATATDEQPHAVAKRAASRPSFEQVSLENKDNSACTDSRCAGEAAHPVLGVGF